MPQTVSFFMKLVYKIVTNGDSLWVRVLRNKYKIAEICLQDISRTRCSYVWHSLAKVWKKFRERMMWRLGDGRTISFVQDDWVLELGILQDHLRNGKYILPQTKVMDFVDNNDC